MKNPAAVTLGTLGGSVKSKKKTAASRKNGKLGGRPPNCKNCGFGPQHHQWQVRRLWGQCLNSFGKTVYVPNTDRPKPLNKVIARISYKRR